MFIFIKYDFKILVLQQFIYNVFNRVEQVSYLVFVTVTQILSVCLYQRHPRMEKGRLYYKGFGPFTQPRGFFSEVILPPRGRDVKGRFYDSWSDSCLGPGLRRVLHQLWDDGTPRDEHDHDGSHDYFCDILCTVSGLDNEFNKLEHFLSTRKRISKTRVTDGKTSTISPNDISYLDFAANSLLELTVCLKHELTVQGKLGRGESFGTVYQTNKLISILENKLNDLLRKLNKFKIDGVRNICCKRCSEHMNQWGRPTCPWVNKVTHTYNQDRCMKNVSVDYLPDNDDHILSCRAQTTGSKHRNVQGRQCKPLVVKNTQNYKVFRDNDPNVRSDSGPWIKLGCIKSKTSKDLHNTFMGAYGRLNSCIVQKRYLNSMTSSNQKMFSTVQNKNDETNHNFSQYKVNNNLVHASSQPSAHLQHNTFRRKRAGKDGSGNYDRSDYNPVVMSFDNNRRFHRKAFIKGKHKQQNSHNKIFQPKIPKNKWSKRVSFYSTSSDQSTSTGDDVSDSYIVLEADIKNIKNNLKQNPNRSSKSGLNKTGKDYSYTNRNKRRKGTQKDPKNNAVKLKRSVDSYSSQENISNKHNYINPNAKTKSHSYRKNKSFQINKPNAPLKRAKSKPSRRRRRSSENEVNNQKYKNPRVYSSRPRSNRKHRARSSKSKFGNFAKGVRNKFSKIRLFSSKPPKDTLESGSSKSSVSSKTYNSKKNHKVYKKSPKRQKIEYTDSRYPSRNRIWSQTSSHEDSSTDSGSSSTVTQLSRSDDRRISFADERNSGSYPYFFERMPSTNEEGSDCSVSEIEEQTVEESCDVCPKKKPPPDENFELADEYEITFEKIKPKKVVRKIPREETTEESTSTLSSESSPSSVSVSASLPEYKAVPKPRKHVRRKRFRNVTIIRRKSLPAQEEVPRMPRTKHRRHRKYIRVGSQKFQESTENVIDYDSYQPPDLLPPIIKDTLSRGTSTDHFQPAEEKFTFHPPVKDTYSRGTSTEIRPLYAKKTSTSDLIKLIQAIGTNTERVITRDTGIDPIPLKQKTLPAVIDVKSKSTNTEKLNIRSTGIDALPASVRPPIVNKGTDPLFYLVQKDKTTNTTPEKKKHITNIGTDPRPIQKLQQATKAINTEPAIKLHAQTETPKGPKHVSKGTTTTPVNVQDQKTSYEKVKTSSRGNNPITIKTFDIGFQFDTVEHKPVVKTVLTETVTQPRVGKTTQTSFIETPKTEPGIEVQTQTDPLKAQRPGSLKVQRKPPPPRLKQRKPSISEEIAVVEAEDPSSPSELSMHLVFEKCQEEIYKRRTKVCKPRCSDCCDRGQRVVVCDNIRSRQMTLNSLSDCNVSSITQKDKSPHSDFEQTPLASKFTSNYDIQTVGKLRGPGRTRKPKLGLECGMIGLTNPINKQSRTPLKDLPAEPDEKSNGTTEKHHKKPGIFESSNTTLTSCDWKNIAEKVKLNQ